LPGGSWVAPRKRIFHRNQRHGGVLHEPGLDAAGVTPGAGFLPAASDGADVKGRYREASAAISAARV